MFIHPRIYALLENPNLSVIMQSSAYSLDEIKATLAIAEQVNKEYDALLDRAGAILDPIPWYSRNEKEMALADFMSADPTIAEGKHSEYFPVKTWQKAIAAQRTYNRKFEKALKEFEICQPNP